MKKEFVLYTRTVCPKCMLVKKMLESAEVEYTAVNLDHNKEAEQQLRDKNFMGLPIALYNNEYYVNVENIQHLVAKITE